MFSDDFVFIALLIVHILFGTAVLLAALGAMATQWLRMPHARHVVCGQVFFWGMVGVFVTALPMSLMRESLFLLLVSIFSIYLAWSGYRYAKRRKGPIAMKDYLASGVMLATAVGMIAIGGTMVFGGDLNGITLLVFGGLGFLLAATDFQIFRSGEYTGKDRIANHLGMMLGATIAAVTAFAVTNFHMDPEFVLWIAPTVIILPLIYYWRNRVLRGK